MAEWVDALIADLGVGGALSLRLARQPIRPMHGASLQCWSDLQARFSFGSRTASALPSTKDFVDFFVRASCTSELDRAVLELTRTILASTPTDRFAMRVCVDSLLDSEFTEELEAALWSLPRQDRQRLVLVFRNPLSQARPLLNDESPLRRIERLQMNGAVLAVQCKVEEAMDIPRLAASGFKVCFINSFGRAKDSRGIESLRQAVNQAERCGMETVATNVANLDELEQLSGCGFDFLQGYVCAGAPRLIDNQRVDLSAVVYDIASVSTWETHQCSVVQNI